MEVREGRVACSTTWVLLSIGSALASVLAAYAGLPDGPCFDVAWTASALAATLGTFAAWRGAQPGNRARWGLWSAASASWLFGQLAWDVYGLIGFPASPNLADAGWWGFALLVMASMLRVPRASRSVRLIATMETISLICAAVAVCGAELWPVAARSRLGLASEVSDLLYPVLYVSATVLTLQAIVGGALRGVRTPPIRLVLGGITAQAAGFSLWSAQLLAGTYVPGNTLLDPLWVVGLSAIGLGGLLAARRPEEVTPAEEPSALGVVLPGVMFLGLFSALLVGRATGASDGATTTLELGLLCSGGALIARSMILGRRMQLMLARERAAMRILADRESELARLNAQLTEDARHDPLTGIGNRRALADDLPMYEALHRDEGTIALALCDVDHFKAYNDLLGHLAGDQALRMIAATVRGTLRSVDAAYRFGGEELLLVLRGINSDEARQIAERVRATVERSAFPHPAGENGVLTVSVGIACGPEDLGQLLARADGALYEAKRLGRNRVVMADEERPLTGPTRERSAEPEGPVPRHLRSMLAVSRAAATGAGVMPVLDALADVITSELAFQVVAVNLLEPDGKLLRVVVVKGDRDAQETLLHTANPLSEWEALLVAGEHIHGATWLRAGSYDWEPEGGTWTPPGVPAMVADAWHPEDMLLLPLRRAGGELLGVLSVDQPLLGRRPTEDEIGVLMAVVDHAGLAVDQVQREDASADGGSDELRLAAVLLLAETLDLRDRSTALHSRTVGEFARRTAVALGLSHARVERIHAAGVLHDLGKLGIADAILHKPGPLDDAEWREMRRHSEVGARILEHAGLRDIAGWVRSHHERIDGGGYPSGLRGDEIPLESRILAVADAYEAMIADRPYRTGIPAAAARDELLRCAGTQFDVGVLRAFLAALDGEDPGLPAGQTPALEPAAS